MSYRSDRTGIEVDTLLDKIDDLNNATTSKDGLLSKEDKAVINALPSTYVAKETGKSLVSDTEKSTWNAKQDVISDLDTIRTGASKGATAVQPTDSSFTGKADKSEMSVVAGTGANADKTTITLKTGTSATVLTSHQDISGKADKATTLAGYGITDASISNGVITLGSNTITPLTSHQSLTDYIQKSTTSGLVKNDGTIDTNTYLTQHQDISNYVQKSQTAGLLKNDGTVDTSTYITSAHEVPSGGNAGQVLAKNSATNYDLKWVNQTQYYPSAYCTTAAGTAAKVASCSLWVATANSYLHVLIGQANTSASALTLNVNSTGAKPIYINGSASSSSNYTLPAGTYIVFYDGTNYYFRTDGQLPGLGSVNKENRVNVDTISGTTLSAVVSTYYVGASVGTLAVTLPTINDATKVYSVVLNIATGSSPAVTFTAATGVTISYSKDFALEASKEYEVNCLWQGTKWLITAVEFESQS